MSSNPKTSKKSGKEHADSKRSTAVYLFTGMAIKMGAVIYLGIYAGQWADGRIATQTPWATIAGALLGVGLALYFVISDLRKL